jgi:hypothetical protein
MAVAAVALIVDSFLPWYVVRWSSTRYGAGQATEHANTASAWAASTSWSAGVALALAAAGGWLFWLRWRSGRGRITATVVIVLAAVVVTAGTGLTAQLESGGEAVITFVPAVAGTPRPGDIVRNALTSGKLGWGYYLGVLLMLTIAGCAPVAGRHHVHTPTGDGTDS